MQIIYLFVKEQSKIINQDINFGSKYIFNYSPISKKLNVEENNLFIEDLFNDKDVNKAELLNITSIIGENGTGKTSLLNLLKDNLIDGRNLQIPLILITKEYSGYRLYYTEDIEISNIAHFENLGFKISKIASKTEKIEEFKIDFGYNLRGLNQTDFIYYSTIFDNPGGSYSLSGLRDISTNGLSISYFKSEQENNYFNTNIKINELSRYQTNEVELQVRFVQAYSDKDIIPFELPKELYITTKDDFFKFSIKNGNLENNLSLKNHIYSIIHNNEEKGPKEYLILNLYISFLLDFYKQYPSFDSFISISKFTNNVGSSIDKVISNLDIISNSNNRASYFKEFITYLKDVEDSTITYPDNRACFLIKKETSEELFTLLDLYSKSVSLKPYLDFNWRNLSSGEKALLTFYSRFFALSQHKIHKTNELKKHLIILIDEGDLYLHPSWQKKFVKILVDFLPTVFQKQGRTIQVIFTTHSPIPASDLFSYNTVFLESTINKNGTVVSIVKDSLNDQKDTFAANIHTLFTDSFFVKDGLLGDFSSNVIDNIIDLLRGRKELSKQERERTKKIIHQIGERILKVKLMQLYNDRFNLDIYDRLDRLEEQLNSKEE